MQRGSHLRCKVTSPRGLARTRPLTSASARQQSACPGLPRNAIFLSFPCGYPACRRPGGLMRRLPPAAVSDPVVPASAVPAAGRFRVRGDAMPSPRQRAARTPPRGPLARPRAAAGHPFPAAGPRCAAHRAALPAAQACVRAGFEMVSGRGRGLDRQGSPGRWQVLFP